MHSNVTSHPSVGSLFVKNLMEQRDILKIMLRALFSSLYRAAIGLTLRNDGFKIVHDIKLNKKTDQGKARIVIITL